ncbi:VOC family protein [Sanguibacter sp. 4.1]|uniref:VOC family protein n=1 Tax=Sanguibacter biliveldensis TaxID=3030830 RepID=A0AAF0Z237_9MICO|nr:VOC family protein [Sanguibacter sp. 4.1]WPF81805.1 VOC family protein [Sanguibacter sp. 4.1]
MQKIFPCLWFGDQAEQAAEFYVSVFERSSILEVSRYGPGAPLPEGTALVVTVEIDGSVVRALNGGQDIPFSDATSLVVQAETQDEVDRLWEALTADGGAPGRCGWLKDKFGFSWQIVPERLGEVMQQADPAAATRVMEALMAMDKISLPDLEAAARG